jgi:hypothetical protein
MARKTAIAKPADALPSAPIPAKGAKHQHVKMTDALFQRICERVADGSMLMQLERFHPKPSR